MQSWGCLRNPIQHIDRLINAQTSQKLLENRLRLKTSIIAVKWLAKQACTFKGHDESVNSRNRGNFIELIKHSAECSKEIAQVVLENAPSYAKYTSSDIQKELLNILANKVRNKIRKDLGDALGSIVNVLTSFAKRLSELKSVWEAEIIDLIASGEVQTGTGANQIHTLQWPGATWWSSHFRSVSRLLDLFSVIRKVFGKLVECGLNNIIRGKAKDFQLMELNNRFTEQTLELLTLSSALNLIDAFKSFKIEDIYSLAERFYPEDFTKIELQVLRRQLECFEIDIHSLQEFQNITFLSELCRRLVETRKSQIYFLLGRLIRLVLTLPVSTATTERAFSAMKLIKTTHRNKMENEFLSDCMVIYIEREIADNIDSDAIVDEFSFLKNRMTQLRQ
ncbi:uncharacterized protein LOC112097887 [Citrus clementina]|uniref:uncharacterized protein LOC112097887 n=1 Tax=Citrus clementina TaxID=85681 RepID=UPI000CED55AA|nr:uncharacterized protein LOC112097887 [Citrus x clementina]